MGKKLYTCLPAVVFLLFLAGMTLALLLTPTRDYSENEKRYLAGWPELSVESVLDGSTQKDLEAVTSDQVPGRDLFVGISAYWGLATGRNTGEEIYYGKDGYLINAPETLNLELFQTNLSRFEAFAAQCGLPASMIIVPSTGYLMEEELPMNHGTYSDDALFAQAEQQLQGITLVDVRQVLQEASQQVCYRTDHHLTAAGNYLMYRTWMEQKGFWVRAPEDYTVTSHPGFYGTTWSGSGFWLTPADTLEWWDSGIPVTVTIQDGGKEPVVSNSLFFPAHLNDLDKYPTYLDGNHGLVTIENPGVQSGAVLVIRDSYAHCFSTFLAENYHTIYLVDYRYYRDSLSAFLAEHPVDELLFLYGIDNLLTDTNSAWIN